MTAYEPDEGAEEIPADEELDEQFRKVEESRHADKRQKWWLFGLVMLLLIAIGIIAGLLIASWSETEQSKQAAANEQVEKQQLAEEARQAICETGDTAIYDVELCERLQVVAGEPIQGNPGPQGPQGPRGPEGEQGPRGMPGAVGPQGLRGLMGEVGAIGSEGEQGSQGVAGAAGADGLDGSDGLNGADGAPGPAGPAGPQGVPGTPGDAGPIGPPGSIGATGNTGPAGPAGPAGIPGATGATGAQGVSIANVECIGEGADSTWQITLSNGTILNGGGPCKVDGPPIPIP